MNAFCKRYSLRSLIFEPTCYKNPANPFVYYMQRDFLRKEHLKVKLHVINKGTVVPASYGMKNETILEILTLQKYLTIRCSGKLRKLCSQTKVLTEKA